MTNKELMMSSDEELIRILHLIHYGYIDFAGICSGKETCDICPYLKEHNDCNEDKRACAITYQIKSWLEAPAGLNAEIHPCKEFTDHILNGID